MPPQSVLDTLPTANGPYRPATLRKCDFGCVVLVYLLLAYAILVVCFGVVLLCCLVKAAAGPARRRLSTWQQTYLRVGDDDGDDDEERVDDRDTDVESDGTTSGWTVGYTNSDAPYQ